MTVQELPPIATPRRVRLQVANGAQVEASYTQGSPSVLVEILTAEGSKSLLVFDRLVVIECIYDKNNHYYI
jgi:hypothetical protein